MINSNNLRNINVFLEKCGFDKNYDLSFLAGDASFRTYYRLKTAQLSAIVMDAPYPENPLRFIEIAQYLQSYHFSSPQILFSDIEQGFLLIEDFGDLTFTNVLKTSSYQEKELYLLATNVLKTIHQKAKQNKTFESYTIDLLLKEILLFLKWYWPWIFKTSCKEEILDSFVKLWECALEKVFLIPYTFVHRDFHVDNLMLLNDRSDYKRCGLLDFQDGLWGPCVYDFVSLVEDARRDINQDLIEELWDFYLEDFDEPDTIRTVGTILSAGRHLKIIGIFSRLYLQNQKKQYLAHIPRVWNLLEKCLEHPELAKIKEWFSYHIPQHQRIVPL